jgi:hypothetical protein
LPIAIAGPKSGEVSPPFSAPLDALVDDPAADVQQLPVLHAARAGGLAVAAGQAAVQVLLRPARHGCAFEHLLDQVDAAARAVELVAQQLVGRAGGGAEAAMHALAQDDLRRLALAGVFELGAQPGLHGRGRNRGGPQISLRTSGISSAASTTCTPSASAA